MLQAYELSCSSNPKIHRREQGILNWQQQVRQLKLRNRNEMKRSLICYCQKTSASADKFGRDDSMSNRNLKPARKIKSASTFEHGFMSQPKDGHSMGVFMSNLWMHLETFYRFTRPHTIIGTIFGITSISLLPLSSLGELSPSFFVGILKVLLPIMFMNIYVVGLNQLFDVEIDKVNKPELPLASGEYTMELGKAIVFAFGFMSFAMGVLFQSPPLFPALVVCFVFGSAYSVELPFLRWKRNGFLAAACILIVRAVTVQLVTFIHIQTHVLGRPLVFTRSLGFALGFMTLFTAVIALFKDIPDVDGDRDFGINSFTVRLGKKKVFWLCISMLLIAYGSAVAIGASSPILMSKLVTVVGHTTLASVVLIKVQAVNLDDNKSIYSFYMFIWKLFYAEYLLIPFVR